MFNVTTKNRNTMKNDHPIIQVVLILLLTGFISMAQENIKTEIEENMGIHFLTKSVYSNQFRGTNCSGVAPVGARPPVSLVPDENLAWKTEIASGVSSPCVWDNFVSLTGYE